MSRLQFQAPPNLPIPGKDYEPSYLNRLLGVLRLYFNTLFNFQKQISGEVGGSYIKTPYGAFSSTTNQTVSAADTPTRVSFDTEEAVNGTYHVAGDGLHITYPGVYNVQFSVQFENSTTSIHEATIWIKQNGIDVPRTASIIAVPSKHGGINGYMIFAANFYVTAAAGDYVEMWWASTSTSLIMEAYAASTSPYTRPAIPSVALTISFVSAV